VPDFVMVALNSTSADDPHGPAAAVVWLTLPDVLRLLAEIQAVRADGEQVQVLRADSITWLGYSDSELIDALAEATNSWDDQDAWGVVPAELADRVDEALAARGDDSVEYREMATRRKTDEDRVRWTSEPKYGDFSFATAPLTTTDLERLLADHLLPREAHFYLQTTVIVGIKDGQVTHAKVVDVLDGLPGEWIDDTDPNAFAPVACPPPLGRTVRRLIHADLTGPEGQALHDGVTIYDPTLRRIEFTIDSGDPEVGLLRYRFTYNDEHGEPADAIEEAVHAWQDADLPTTEDSLSQALDVIPDELLARYGLAHVLEPHYEQVELTDRPLS
jgi:hypothetical protein